MKGGIDDYEGLLNTAIGMPGVIVGSGRCAEIIHKLSELGIFPFYR